MKYIALMADSAGYNNPEMIPETDYTDDREEAVEKLKMWIFDDLDDVLEKGIEAAEDWSIDDYRLISRDERGYILDEGWRELLSEKEIGAINRRIDVIADTVANQIRTTLWLDPGKEEES